MNYVERDVLIGGGIEAYRAYNATGDGRTAVKAGASGAGTILGASALGLVAFFGFASAFGGFVSGEPGIGALCLLLGVVCAWGAIALCLGHMHRMNRWMAPQAVPSPPRAPTKALVPRGQQYTYDLTTGTFHKNW
jgi:hypothetical protein